MSVEALAVVLHHSQAKSSDKLVLLGIANHAGDGGSWPTIATLARYANVEERSVQRSIDRLVKLGELSVLLQAGGTAGIPAGRRPNRYDVLLACPATCDRTMNHRPVKLPDAQADLWISGVTPTSPGDAHVTPRVTPTSPGGVTPTSPKPSIEPNHVTPVVLQGEGSARGSVRLLCNECLQDEDVCRARAHLSGHDFTPKRRKPSVVLGPILENYSS